VPARTHGPRATKSTRQNHRYRRINRPSLRNGFTAYSALSPATNSSCHRHRRIDGLAGPGRARNTSTDLTPATGARTTRLCRPHQRRSSERAALAHRPKPTLRSRPRARRCRVHRIPGPTSVTIAIRPSWWAGTARVVVLIWVRREAKCFCAEDWTTQISLKSLEKIAPSRMRAERFSTAARSSC
jgi:hypothetical protein